MLKVVSGPFCIAMADRLSPIVHLRVRARELLTERLCYEGVSEAGRTQADALAGQLWGDLTADSLMRAVKDVLPRDEFLKLLGFCNDKYPLLYSTLPSEVTGATERFSWSQHSSAFQVDNATQLIEPQLMRRYLAGGQHALDPVPSPGPADSN